MRGNTVRWPGGIVPYEFVPGFGKYFLDFRERFSKLFSPLPLSVHLERNVFKFFGFIEFIGFRLCFEFYNLFACFPVTNRSYLFFRV